MTAASTANLVDALRQFHLLEAAQLDEVSRDLQARCPESRALARELVQRGWLTPYQVNQLFQDRARDLLLGSYVLLERLGEGGMGAVFKARNWKLGKIVALKVILKERLANPDAVRRFHHEIRAAAQLNHPNIVLAYDADQVADTHFFAMEYVKGTDLSQLVKQSGPLPVAQACDFIRQAALGLQHAHERGLIHRDIKPSNLLVTSGVSAVVKVLDLGLARLQGASTAETSGSLTESGAVMGTPDYIAPEQARDSHDVDIRADLYSLGCTFYFLLTGQAPFPTGTLTAKLLAHQMDEAKPVELLRPGVPAEVSAVVRKLMAKKPADRYQTPGALAAALEGLARGLPAAGIVDDRTLATGGHGMAAAGPDTLASALAALGTADTTEAPDSPRRLRQQAEQRRWLRINLAGGAVLLGLLVLVLALMFWQGDRPAGSPSAATGPSVLADEAGDAFNDWCESVAKLPADKQVQAIARKLKERNPRFDGKVKPTITNGMVTGLHFLTDNVTDLVPVRALAGLKTLSCNYSDGGKSKLADLGPLKGMALDQLVIHGGLIADLAPLKGMPLTSLQCNGNQKFSDLSPLQGMKLRTLDIAYNGKVSDLSPLQEMPLTSLRIDANPVSDLSPLKGMKLTSLYCYNTKVSDLSPLQGMPLTFLSCWRTGVSDLAPLKGMKLTTLLCSETKVADLTPLQGMPLTSLNCDGTRIADLAPLKGMPLKSLNCIGTRIADLAPLEGMSLIALSCDSTRVTDLKPLQGMPLTHLQFYGTPVADLTPLKGMPLTKLGFGGTKVADLSPLQGMRLTQLHCGGTQVTDLAPLKGMPLTNFACQGTKVADLGPLKGMPLTYLYCGGTPVSDLTPLTGMPLTTLLCKESKVTDLAPLKGMPLEELACDFKPERDTEIVRSLKTLKKINDKPAAQFWKEAGNPPAPKP